MGDPGVRKALTRLRVLTAFFALSLALSACGSQPSAPAAKSPEPAAKPAAPSPAAPATPAAPTASAPAKSKYPERPIRLLITHSPGGSTDTTARLVATNLVEKHLGQPLVPENMTGAGGNVARAYAYKQPADGYTLLVSQMPSMDSGAIITNEFDAMKFTHVYNISGQDYNVVAVPGNSPIKTIKDLVEASKKKELTNSGSGVGANSWLIAMMLRDTVGVNLRYVPFDSGKEAATAVAGGQVDMGTGGVESFMSLHRQGRVRVLATFGPKRMPETQEFPTLVELGYPTVKMDQLTGIFAPPGTPKEIVDTLAAAFDKAFKEPDLISAAKKAKVTLMPMGPADFIKEHKEINDVIVGMTELLKANVKN